MLDTKHKVHYTMFMNQLSREKRVQIINLLVEGNSMRATARIADVAFNSVKKLFIDTARVCAEYQDKTFRNLTCKKIQMDEVWSFVYSKQKNVPDGMEGKAGDVWTWVAIDADSKLVPSWRIGKRDSQTANEFISDLASRLKNRVQITSDGFRPYLEAIEGAFGASVDYAMLVKIYGEDIEGQKRYSPAECVGAKKTKIIGDPDLCCISTSFVERQNLTLRMSIRRFTRLSNGFSKKIENHAHSIALHYAYYNLCRIHKSLRVTPAMAAGVTDRVWKIDDIVNLVEQTESNSK